MYGIGWFCSLTFFMLEAATAKIYDLDGAFGRVT
jgi:hypothetical protein